MDVKTVETRFLKMYIEGEIRPEMKGGMMSDEVYTAVLDHTIAVCCDAVIVNKAVKTFYLLKRVAKPMAGIWCIGGRRLKGETPLQGIVRKFRLETGLELPEDRFTFITVTEYLWQDRQQAPQEKGSHNIAHQFAVELSDEELEVVARGLEGKEYDPAFGLQEFDREQLIAENVHPMIIDIYDQIFG